MRFCDMLLKDNSIEEWVKQGLDGVPVIECDNVSRYFFEENDQEYWDMKDFPNIAPPFENFWLDFKAPSRVLSKERGLTIWKPPAPNYWGFLCFGIPFTGKEERDAFVANTHEYHRDYFADIIDEIFKKYLIAIMQHTKTIDELNSLYDYVERRIIEEGKRDQTVYPGNLANKRYLAGWLQVKNRPVELRIVTDEEVKGMPEAVLTTVRKKVGRVRPRNMLPENSEWTGGDC